MEKHAAGIGQVESIALASDEELNTRLRESMKRLSDAVDSPQAHLILSNAVLTLLELPEHAFSIEKAYKLLTDAEARASAIKELAKETPPYWGGEWNSLWKKDADPLLSKAQQRVVRRASLVTFWSNEWSTIASDARNHVGGILEAMGGGK